MSKLYDGLVQEYYHYQKEKMELTQEYKKIMAKLDLVEDMLIGLNDLLCKNGEHIYEHFEEGETHETRIMGIATETEPTA